MVDYATISSYIITGFVAAGGAIGAYRQAIKGETKKTDNAFQEHLKAVEDSREAWKERFNQEHEEYKAYRAEMHQKLNDINKQVLELYTENADLKAKTDMSKVMAALEKMMIALEEITKRLEALDRRQ